MAKKKETKKICRICKRVILPKDNYVRLTDYLEGEIFDEGFYHTLCYNNQIKGVNPEQSKMKKAMIATLANLNRKINSLGGGETTVVEV